MATPYSFTQPIRYYKANDPYYYEVDNIPLRQLEENILFIKDKLEGPQGTGGNTFLTENSELNIMNIKQLKPKALGGRSVHVNAGRFVSRINDAFDITDPLTKLLFLNAPPTGTNTIANLKQEWDEAARNEVWDSFVNTSTKKYGMNGLEYTYTFYSSPGGVGSTWGTTTSNQGGNYPRFKDGTGSIWPGQSLYSLFSAPLKVGQISLDNAGGDNTYGYSNLAGIHLAFVQMWRGVFRTSVVDFPDTTIDVPEWSDDDFYYLDESGAKVTIPAQQRIDLLVAYSLPVDASSTTLPNFEDDFGGSPPPEPRTITEPTLGLVRGAGIGIEKGVGLDKESGNVKVINTLDGKNDEGAPPGSARMVANINDAVPTAGLGAPTGLTDATGAKVYGSFPSPDDLLNIAPLLALDATNDSTSAFNLIGQAALPLAYVVVKKGQTTITQNDIIDIRPFLRTTEFTYNERAGVAAANPPLSLANPAVGAYQLQDITTQLNTAITGVGNTVADEAAKTNGRVLYTDYVMGGLAYGVEGTMLTMCDYTAGQETGPWGTDTTNQTDANKYTAADGVEYDFASFSSSKAFMDYQTLATKEAFLEYVYNNKQENLKKWISNPNASPGLDSGTYLGLPPKDGRNIPLYPEWDLPVGSNAINAVAMMGGTAGLGPHSPKPTWWMSIEGQNLNRGMIYAPPALVSTQSVNDVQGGGPENFLEKMFGFGSKSSNAKGGVGMMCVCSKRFEITFPGWVRAYDVLVEYVNCGPVAAASINDPGTNPQYGLGCGLYINKGSLVSVEGANKAIITLNSASQTWPEDQIIKDGKIQTKIDSFGSMTDGFLWNNLSYSVCLPQFPQVRFGVGDQNDIPGPDLNALGRSTPKFGASFYPTIKYTIIGYEDPPISHNTGLGADNDWTYVQNAGNSEPINQLLVTYGEGENAATYQTKGPYSTSPSPINIQ